jgi:hypothetical protein
MSQLKAPKKPVENWEQVRDEWVRAVEQLITDVEAWCEANGWPTRRIEKHIEESKIGEYAVPALLIQVDLVKLMLEPGARFVSGDAEGVLDLYRMPEYADSARFFRQGGKWHFFAVVTDDSHHQPDSDVVGMPGTLDQTSFTDLVRLLK